MEKSQPILELTHREFYFLSGLLGCTALVGTPDPFSGYLAEEVSAIRRETLETLIQKRVMETFDEGLGIHQAVFPYLDTCCFPDVVFYVKRVSPGSDPYHAYFYLSDDAAVERTDAAGIPDTYHFRVHKSRRVLRHKLKTLLQEPCGRKKSGQTGKLTRTMLQLLLDVALYQDESKIQTALENDGVSEPFGTELISACRGYQGSAEMVRYEVQDGEWTGTSATFWYSKAGSWFLEPDPSAPSETVLFQPCNWSDAGQHIDTILRPHPQ